jgi:hypothetical protein
MLLSSLKAKGCIFGTTVVWSGVILPKLRLILASVVLILFILAGCTRPITTCFTSEKYDVPCYGGKVGREGGVVDT